MHSCAPLSCPVQCSAVFFFFHTSETFDLSCVCDLRLLSHTCVVSPPTKPNTSVSQPRHKGDTPIFGICMGHQLLSLAAGATTSKMPFGNRGQNIPTVNLEDKRCYITPQNHGYAVDADSFPEGWRALFTNTNDGSNEGCRHLDKPFMSVQFHPEANGGPQDTQFLFDAFLDQVRVCLCPPPLLPPPPLLLLLLLLRWPSVFF
jgi:anthranilate/para-aminobenzoate synthase component II